MNHYKKSLGFTLVELMLAMGFASVLLIAIAMTVIQISNIYERGMTLKEVNQAGRSIASELQRNINNSASFKLVTCTASTPTCNYVNRTWGGRLCVGQYSYIWNYGNTVKLASPGTNINSYLTFSANKIRFVKVIDPNADYCANPTRAITNANATELLDVSQHDLAIHGFDISTSAFDSRTGESLYNISFLLGTNEVINGVSTINYPVGVDPSCKLPNQVGADQTYCSVNKFNILTHAGSVSE